MGEAVTICEGQMAALCRSSSLLPSLQSSVLCFAGLLLSAFSPPCGRGNSSSFPHIQQQPGMQQGRVSGLPLSRGVLSMSIITSFRGRWTFLAHRFAVCYIGKGMAPGRGSGKRLLHGGAVRAAGRSSLGSWRTGREVLRQRW